MSFNFVVLNKSCEKIDLKNCQERKKHSLKIDLKKKHKVINK